MATESAMQGVETTNEPSFKKPEPVSSILLHIFFI